MPLYKVEKTSNNLIIGFWHIIESVNDMLPQCKLTPVERKIFEGINHEKIKKQWLAVRLLTAQICGEDKNLYYDEYGKPHCLGVEGVSVSHSGEYAVLAIHPEEQIGIDFELVSENILKIKSKFIGQEEEKQLEAARLTMGDALFYHLIWSFKEAVYKLYGKKNIIFKENIRIHSITESNPINIQGLLITPQGENLIEGNLSMENGYVLCYCWYRKI